ncbi:MAG TPA: NAD(+) kinase [Candidatus Cloacimonas sp.]|mgnify:FL=1|jgi:NAD+ kinase|nr:NAD(+) kinase [Candidatus Cloacimonas sp.]
MKQFAVYINPNLDTGPIFESLAELSRRLGLKFYGTQAQRDIIPAHLECCDPDQGKMPQIDCVLVFGGDGTILRAKTIAILTGAPILGINLGWLGFLSETTFKELESSIQSLINGKYKLINRMLLNCKLRRKGKVVFEGLALNDAVIYKAETPRMINIRTYSEGRFVFSARCDGAIACTPTGSTAYNLSAGGPLLTPEMRAIVVSHLNPHLLSIRPMVFPSTNKVCLKVTGLHEPAWLQLDGENVHQMLIEDEVIVTEADVRVEFIKLSARTFYRTLRNKLHLGK